eukprot:TRINITY_DN20673_c0_g1_i3.p2 TRINITY_DN20673_c0_g1~~TRINITY_DN20673_c0_g1_i3.p2  ORF type:complete len:279 (-),score=21.67 TRINITY_DN20673_c0_g1_i3:395-1231(-)
MNRQRRAEVARQTCEILNQGQYINGKGATINFAQELRKAVENTTIYWEYENEKLQSDFENLKIDEEQSIIECVNETTLQAAERVKKEGYENVVCLNFGSAKNPGGGFLGGSQAQEESLARCSGLYACLTENNDMYNDNKRTNSTFYSDHMIYSPSVPVFRNDNDQLLDEPYYVSFITAAAVNAGLVRKRSPNESSSIGNIMQHRIQRVLTLALLQKNDAIILGAWGCGVFQNDPRLIAECFAQSIRQDERFVDKFRKIVFAIPEGKDGHLEIFKSCIL